jgi:hypothetical protein
MEIDYEERVTELLGDYVLGSDIQAIAADYRAAVNAADVDSVDFWAIAKRHDIEP